MNNKSYCAVLTALLLTSVSTSRADDRPVAAPIKPAYTLKLDIRNVRDPGKGTTKVVITIADKTVDLKSFDSELATIVRAGKALGIAPVDITLVIRAERDVPVSSVQQIIVDAQNNSLERFAMKAIEARQATPTKPARTNDGKTKIRCHKRKPRATESHPRG